MDNSMHNYIEERTDKGTQIHDFLKDYVEQNSTYFYIEETDAYAIVFAKAEITYYNAIVQQSKYSCGYADKVDGISLVKTHYLNDDYGISVYSRKPLLRNFSNTKMHDIIGIYIFLEEIKALLQSYNEEMKEYKKAVLIEQMKNL